MPRMELFVVVKDGQPPELVWRGGETSRPSEARRAEVHGGVAIQGKVLDSSAVQGELADARHGAIAVAETAFESGKGLVVRRLEAILPAPEALDFVPLFRKLVEQGDDAAALDLGTKHASRIEVDPYLWMLRVRALHRSGQRDEARRDAMRLLESAPPKEHARGLWYAFDTLHRGEAWPKPVSEAAVRWWNAHGCGDPDVFPQHQVALDHWPRPILVARLDQILGAKIDDPLVVEEASLLLERLTATGDDDEVAKRRMRVEKARTKVGAMASKFSRWPAEVWPDGAPRVLSPDEIRSTWGKLDVECVAFSESHVRDLDLPEEAKQILLAGCLPKKGRAAHPGLADWSFVKPKEVPLVDWSQEADLHDAHESRENGWKDGPLYYIGKVSDEVGARLCVDRKGRFIVVVEDTLTCNASSLASLATLLLAGNASHRAQKRVYGSELPKSLHGTVTSIMRAIDPECDMLLAWFGLFPN